MELTFESFPKSRIPEYQCIHIQAFFSPNSFLPQALHDMDLETRATPYVVVIVVSLGTLPTCSMERGKQSYYLDFKLSPYTKL